MENEQNLRLCSQLYISKSEFGALKRKSARSEPQKRGPVLSEIDTVDVRENSSAEESRTKVRRTIFIAGLAKNITNFDVMLHFARMGNIEEVDLPLDEETRQRKGYGFIRFESEDVVRYLLKCSTHFIKEKHVIVKEASPVLEQLIEPKTGGRGIHSGRGGRQGGKRGRKGYDSQNRNRDPSLFGKQLHNIMLYDSVIKFYR